MKTLISLFSIVLLAPSLVAQNAPIPQDLPSELRKTRDAVQRKVEQVIPAYRPLQGPMKRLDNNGLLNRVWVTDRQIPAAEGRGNAGTVEDRIAALEAKVEALQREIETQKAVIRQLRELLDQQKKN